MNYNLLAVTQSNGVIKNKPCYVKSLQNTIILNHININQPCVESTQKITYYLDDLTAAIKVISLS